MKQNNSNIPNVAPGDRERIQEGKDNETTNAYHTILEAEKKIDRLTKLLSDICLSSNKIKLLNNISAAESHLFNTKLPVKDWSSNTKKICYCGSLRFLSKFKELEYQSVLDGNIALLPCCMFVDIEREHGRDSDYKMKADELHKRKIEICDEVFIINIGGYIGESTRSEINYALAIGKPIFYLEGI